MGNVMRSMGRYATRSRTVGSDLIHTLPVWEKRSKYYMHLCPCVSVYAFVYVGPSMYLCICVSAYLYRCIYVVLCMHPSVTSLVL